MLQALPYSFIITWTTIWTSVLGYEFPEESDQFCFLRVSCFANLKGVVGLIIAKASDNADFNPLRPFLSGFHTASSFHSFTSSHTASSSIPRTFSSVFWLSGTCWVFIFSLSLVTLLIIVFSVTLFLSWPSPFFILMEINYKEVTPFSFTHVHRWYTCVHAWGRRGGTGRVWTQKRYLCCHTHLDASDSWT